MRGVVTFVVLGLSMFSVLGSSGQYIAEAAGVSFAPNGDAYVSADKPTRNFGIDGSLRIDSTPRTTSYLKFTVSGISSTVTPAATLKLKNAKSSALGYELRVVGDTSWLQTAITYANAPATGNVLASSGPTKSGTWTTFNVSSVVKTNGSYSFALVALSGSATAVSSLESTTPPQLIIDTMSSTVGSIIPTGFTKTLGAYDPAHALAGLSTLSVDHYFVSWDKSTQWIAGVDQEQALLQNLADTRASAHQVIVSLEPWAISGLSASNLLQDVVAGKYDLNIQWACRDFATHPGTVTVRWGHEMENLTGRYPWATSNATAFVAAYRYFVDKCRALAPNTRYMWSPAGNRNLSAYWPGSMYVDYLGLSVYDYPDWEVSYYGYNRSFHQNFTERYGYVANYSKPVFIAEFAATGSSQVQWLADALADMSNFPLLQGAIFFNAKDPAGWGKLPAPDWRIEPTLLSLPI